MAHGSAGSSDDDRSFIGFYTDPELKQQATQQAEAEGVSLSEWMRRRLKESRQDQVAAA